MQGGLPTLPVPAFAAMVLCVLAFVAARRVGTDGGGRAGWWLPALVLACAGQAALVALVQHYGVLPLRRVLPVTACALPPLAWVAFARTALGRRAGRGAAGHLLPPLAAALLSVAAPRALDAVLPAVFLGYGAAMLWRLRSGADAVPGLRLATGSRPAWLWRLVAVSLIGSGLSDAMIAAAIAAGRAAAAPWIVTLGSTATLALVGWVAVAGDLRPAPLRDEGADAPPPGEDEADAALLARLDALLATTELYLDPDLSLARLARRLGVPAKRLSAAVNRATGENVSRRVNARRVAAARARLEAGDNVTAAWLASGFAARSNFNREFKRITGTTPSALHASETRGRAPGSIAGRRRSPRPPAAVTRRVRRPSD